MDMFHRSLADSQGKPRQFTFSSLEFRLAFILKKWPLLETLMRHLLILTHEKDHYDRFPYITKEMIPFWREIGWRVSTQAGPGSPSDANLVLLHVDLTIIPKPYLECLKKCPMTLNGKVHDISKSVISKHLLKSDDVYEQPVIVKSNLNCGGSREALLARPSGPLSWPGRLLGKVGLRKKPGLSIDYHVYPSLGEVPDSVWSEPNLVVERFLPERRGDYYCLRTWLFLGDRELNSISFSHEPIVKSHTVVRRELDPELPDELRQRRKELGFDFGKFDYGIVDGQVVLYDTNHTPSLGAFSRESMKDRLQHLAAGLDSFL